MCKYWTLACAGVTKGGLRRCDELAASWNGMLHRSTR